MLPRETFGPQLDEQRSLTLERVGKHIFWLPVAALLIARVVYFLFSSGPSGGLQPDPRGEDRDRSIAAASQNPVRRGTTGPI
jgi:hypothetical protein